MRLAFLTTGAKRQESVVDSLAVNCCLLIISFNADY